MLKNLSLISILISLSYSSLAQDDMCKYRGDLDILYCDENKDLVADPPKDSKKLRNPSTFVYAFTPVDNPAVYADIYAPFTQHLEKCTGKKTVFFQVQTSTSEVEAMRSGRLHVGGFSTGTTAFAVNNAGAIPFAVEAFENGIGRGYKVFVIVKKDSPYQKLSDLKGKKFAHVSPSSNAGHMVPIAFFPKEGLTPGKDYEILFSGKHDQSIMGVNFGDYDGAAVTSDIFDRMDRRGQIKKENFRILYESEEFPAGGPYAYAHDLAPEFVAKIKECFFNFKFTSEMTKTLEGATQFVPITYEKDWELVREVAEKAGAKFNNR